MVIAIDGPAGAGKSTVARTLAKALGFTYLDSGAMYRSVALSGPTVDPAALDIAFAGDRVLLNDRDVTEAIRTAEVSERASRVAANPSVREAMVQKQRELLAGGDWVAEGRDIGTVVAPDAERDSTREASPLRAAPDAVQVDTTGKDVGQVVDEIAGLARERTARR